jgi:hypothetical protein
MKLNSLNQLIQAVLPSLENLRQKNNTETSSGLDASRYQSTAESLASETKSQVSLNQKQLKSELANPDAKTLEKLSKVNQKRSAKGMAPLSLPLVTEKLEAIYKDSALSDKQKKQKIEQLRKQLGLSKGEMKALFTKRIEAAYKNAEKRLAAFEQAKSEQLKSELQQAEATHGKDSAQAKAVQGKLDSLKSSLEPERQQLKAHAKFFGSLYPSFFSKLGSAFKKIGQVLSKGLAVLAKVVRFIPAFGPVVSGALRSVQSLIQGKFGQLGKSFLEILSGAKFLLPMIPGVGAIASMAVTGIEAIVKASRGAKTL